VTDFEQGHMGDFTHKEEERLSRQQAAERLIDIAYALTASGSFELNAAGQRIKVPVANELHLGRELKSKGGQVELELDLTWSAAEGDPRSD
jgi:amphi-Trp domain-containing protein